MAFQAKRIDKSLLAGIEMWSKFHGLSNLFLNSFVDKVPQSHGHRCWSRLSSAVLRLPSRRSVWTPGSLLWHAVLPARAHSPSSTRLFQTVRKINNKVFKYPHNLPWGIILMALSPCYPGPCPGTCCNRNGLSEVHSIVFKKKLSTNLYRKGD
jgi:hypothetical protein